MSRGDNSLALIIRGDLTLRICSFPFIFIATAVVQGLHEYVVVNAVI